MSNGCASIGTDGRWRMQDCSQSFQAVCQSIHSGQGRNAFIVSETSGPWQQAGNSCPKGYMFSAPTGGLFNSIVTSLANGKSLWINYTP